MVGVAQLAELRIVDPVVVGSSPIAHPIQACFFGKQFLVSFALVFGPLAQFGRAVDS
ncbi:hypothetical protein BN874_1620037 [Candidatus Contendobacter odensis Run_B_J11]|uniref:Uncharacterized protein n=1 Tax=Candidatus Contendobacter odensis Run_B_J11 TaxID=1400861 RepID=A0A7U7GAW4_9GAMM|nr:hypothetical protein BN874_1620037 [Candidatus Contendobacter odensis Run_B_J11]